MSDNGSQNTRRPARWIRLLQALSPRTLGGALVALAVIAIGAAAILYFSHLMMKQWEIERLKEIVARLEAEHRVAQAAVVSQKTDPAGKVIETTLKFAEVDRDGRTLPPRVLTVPGEEVYFDALLIKFDREFVKLGDPLRGKNIHLFRKVFGSGQKPEDGFALDAASKDGIPDIYRAGRPPSAFEIKLWKRFWELAGDPRAAEKQGVRVTQIEAVGIRPLPGKLYTITIEHAGGLSIVARDDPMMLDQGAPPPRR